MAVAKVGAVLRCVPCKVVVGGIVLRRLCYETVQDAVAVVKGRRWVVVVSVAAEVGERRRCDGDHCGSVSVVVKAEYQLCLCRRLCQRIERSGVVVREECVVKSARDCGGVSSMYVYVQGRERWS